MEESRVSKKPRYAHHMTPIDTSTFIVMTEMDVLEEIPSSFSVDPFFDVIINEIDSITQPKQQPMLTLQTPIVFEQNDEEEMED